MHTLIRAKAVLALALVAALCAPAGAQNANILQPIADLERLLAAEPMLIKEAQISRPNARGDITLRADVSFGGSPPLRVKLRKALPGAEEFNNVPRYDLAAYELQKLFLDAADYVVPPTALRMVALEDFARYSPDVQRTFAGADQVLGVVQYWLHDIKAIADVYDAQRFADDPLYARHIGQLNVLTYLVAHRDSNVGNFLIGREEKGARVFSIDHGVAFASTGSDRGELWRSMRVDRLPADAIARLRDITPQTLTERLGVLAEWKLAEGKFVSTPAGKNLSARHGVRLRRDTLQLGLTTSEIMGVQRLLRTLLDRVDSGKITAVPPDSAGAKQ